VGAFAERVRSADAIVLGTPLYHGSYSGVLKDALDLLASDGFDDKPVGLVSHGAGIRACTLPCEHMRAIVRAMGGVSTQSQIGTTKSDFESNAEGTRTLVNPDILARVETMARELIALSYGMAAKRIAERKLG
jgi:NAD(P)H-dependent FMN reductase